MDQEVALIDGWDMLKRAEQAASAYRSWQVLLTDALQDLAAPDSDYVQKLLRSAPNARANIAEFNDYIEKFEQRLANFKKIWPGHREEGLDIAQTSLVTTFDSVIDYLKQQEESGAKQLADVQRAIRTQKWMPAFLQPMHRWEDYLIDACSTFRDIRWDVMAIRANKPSTELPTKIKSSSDLRRLIGR